MQSIPSSEAPAGLLSHAAALQPRIAVIADDDEFFRMALAAVLTQHCAMDRVIQTASYDEALAAIGEEASVALALFDLDMPGMSGPALLHHLREGCENVGKVAVVTASNDRGDIIASLQAGAHGYVCKSSGVQEMAAALGQILDGRIYVPRLLAELPPRPCHPSAPLPLAARRARNGDAPRRAAAPGPGLGLTEGPSLSPRQSRVLAMLVDGKSNKEIARELNLGAGTVKVHMAALFAKLGVANRAAAAVAGTRLLDLS